MNICVSKRCDADTEIGNVKVYETDTITNNSKSESAKNRGIMVKVQEDFIDLNCTKRY